MATLDTTTFDYAFKTLYTDSKILNMVYSDQPWLAMVPKFEQFGGDSFREPVIYANSRGRSASFSKAQASKGPHKGVAFTMTRKHDYAIASINSETIYASEGSEMALLSALETEMDGAIGAIKRSLGIALFGDGSGRIGTIAAAGVSGTTITLDDAEEITNFDQGMYVVFANSVTEALRDSGTYAEVEEVDRDAGTFEVDAVPTGAVAGDVVFAYGDYESASDTNKIKGLGAWLPQTAPTSGDSFNGVDRSVDATRLGGVRINCSGLALDEALTKIVTRIHREGGAPDCAWISHDRWHELVSLLGAKAEYTTFERGDIGFSGVVIRGPKGMVKVYPDVNAPSDKVYVTQLNTWKLGSIGPCPRVLMADGLSILRDPTSDSYNARIGYYADLWSRAPGFNGVGYNFGS